MVSFELSFLEEKMIAMIITNIMMIHEIAFLLFGMVFNNVIMNLIIALSIKVCNDKKSPYKVILRAPLGFQSSNLFCN